MNNIPKSKNGAITIIEPGFPEKEWKKTVPDIEARIKRIPPAISHFHAMIKITINIKTGILCIRNPRIFKPKDSFPSNTSNENIVIKRIERIDNIRGIQYKIFDAIY
jgi:hypothetical protein